MHITKIKNKNSLKQYSISINYWIELKSKKERKEKKQKK